MRAWIGKFISAVGVIHSCLGVAGLRDTFAEIIHEGLINTVNGQPDREFAFWFVAIGLFWVLFGAVIDDLERRNQPLPGFIAWGLGALTLVGVSIMPISGWWLLFVPVAALFRRGRRGELEA